VRVADAIIQGRTCGEAWAGALTQLLAESDKKLLHLQVQIAEPGVENPAIRTAVDTLLGGRGLDPVMTVVNTVFPLALAEASNNPQDLADRYRAMYPRIRSERSLNRRGTYFGRMVNHPTDGKPVDQLNRIINRLRTYGHNGNHAATVYEESTSTAVPEPCDGEPSEASKPEAVSLDEATHGLSMPIVGPRTDSMPLGFPCLVHISFQHVGDQLHAVAQYRSQYMVQRGYGNYLALGLLQRYIAESAGFRTGKLTVITGQAEADGRRGDAEQALAGLTQLPLFASTATVTPISPPRVSSTRRADPEQLPLLPDQP